MAWLCTRCNKAQATFHLTDIARSGEKTERHLCERCAAEEGLHVLEKPVSMAEAIEKFVIGSKAAAPLQNLVCEECGISYREFRNQGLLGCAKDYDVFRDVLAPLIERAHDGATHHTGKTPKSMGLPRTTQQDVRRLKRLLQEAVAAEDYERAADLRDRIRKAEQA